MKILIVKTSSLGDVLHALPALTDAAHALPAAQFDWVVEESFAEIPSWHPAVTNVIPVAMRRWRKGLFTAQSLKEWRHTLSALRASSYDIIIDAQGLLKSAVLAACARGERHGFNLASAREPLATLFYQRRHAVSWQLHAVERLRRLFAAVLGYAPPDGLIDYGLPPMESLTEQARGAYLVFLHGTAWRSKQWPEEYWCELTKLAASAGLRVLLPAGSPEESERAHRIAATGNNAEVLPSMNLTQIAAILAGARGVVGVDTGLAHCAAALSVPAVTLYGATDPGLTGALGNAQRYACAEFTCAPCLRRECNYRGRATVFPACYETIPPNHVWKLLADLLAAAHTGTG